MAQKKYAPYLYLCEPKLPGDFLVDNKRAQISNGKKNKNPPSTVNLHGFSPQRTPTSLGPLKGTASVRPWPKEVGEAPADG